MTFDGERQSDRMIDELPEMVFESAMGARVPTPTPTTRPAQGEILTGDGYRLTSGDTVHAPNP